MLTLDTAKRLGLAFDLANLGVNPHLCRHMSPMVIARRAVLTGLAVSLVARDNAQSGVQALASTPVLGLPDTAATTPLVAARAAYQAAMDKFLATRKVLEALCATVLETEETRAAYWDADLRNAYAAEALVELEKTLITLEAAEP